MPIYEYDCDNCGETLEVIQKIKEKPLSRCPSCGKNKLKKRTSLNSFQLKGSGWYRDSYGMKSEKNESNKSLPTSDTKESKKPDTKSPAA